MYDFTMLAKAMDLKREGENEVEKEVNAEVFLDDIDKLYSNLVVASFGGGATSYLDLIESMHAVLDFEEASMPMTLMEMLEKGEQNE